MRRFLALARTAALESLAEPLTAVLFLSGFAVTHLAPAFHYHQFGESGRLARECGFSALLVFGLVFATGAAIRTIGREIESGTAAAALALAVPRTLFLAARLAGVLATLILFAAAIACATALMMNVAAAFPMFSFPPLLLKFRTASASTFRLSVGSAMKLVIALIA